MEQDLELRLETIKELVEVMLIKDEEEHNLMIQLSRFNNGFTSRQKIAIENCLEDLFNDSDSFVNITNYRKEVYEFRMLQSEGMVSQKEFDIKMHELEEKYPFCVQFFANTDADSENDKQEIIYNKIRECMLEANEALIDMLATNSLDINYLTNIFRMYIIKHFEYVK